MSKRIPVPFTPDEEASFLAMVEAIPDQMITPAAELAGLRKVTEKRCAHCGKPFEGITVARYCSAACRVTAFRQRKRARDRGG